jgi:hypothetical protein
LTNEQLTFTYVLDALFGQSDAAVQCCTALMKGFVHEVLHCSCTSGSVLQTALCYLEAIRAKVPELATQEKEVPGSTCQKESVERIIQGDVSTDVDGFTSSSDIQARICLLDTIRINLEVDSSFLKPRLHASKSSLHKPKPS